MKMVSKLHFYNILINTGNPYGMEEMDMDQDQMEEYD